MTARGPAQDAKPAAGNDTQLTLDTHAVAPLRFIAAHGRRGMVDGYAAEGVEIWSYPFQILSGYRVAFLPHGATTPIHGEQILSRVTYEPASIARTYLGPGFIVHEKLFVPLDEAGAILSYQVDSAQQVEIVVHATPVLNLMWPGALGGQSTEWDSALSAFMLSEPMDGYSAVVGSEQIVAHDEIANSTTGGESAQSLGFTLRPDTSGAARIFVALNPAHAADRGALFRRLIRDRQALEEQAAAHWKEFWQHALRVETPDPQVNQAIAWAEVALDQAWVCNTDLGCGFVAGYGPSRGARRPQYDWFFAGDGLVAADATLAFGDNARTRQELEFILRYQDRKTGMIWHELSQSAGLIDWAGKYPYMFVHVDITFDFLSAVERYVTTSGDADFARSHWEALDSAYRYCRSLIDPATALPRIPSDKEGGDEQDRISDDLGLSTSWVQAAQAFAHLAALAGHPDAADEATRASHLARVAIPTHYWDARQSFWVSGHTSSGENSPELRSGPGEALALHLFNTEEETHVLDELASSSFQTGWGTRGVSAASVGYDPASYAKGSVWAVATASLAQTFWEEHRPVTALGLWRSLLPWSSLDSLGHMDEVLAGGYYRPQTESVPEQTWSSAGFLDATVHGLLGLSVDSIANRIDFSPHLPATWNSALVEHIEIGNASAGFALKGTPHGLTLTIDNSGAPFKIAFTPEIPLGAQVKSAELDHRPIAATLQANTQETSAKVLFDAPHGQSALHIEWSGGVAVIADPSTPVLGMPDSSIHAIDVHLAGNALTIVADVPSDRESHFQLKTEWELLKVEGAIARSVDQGLIELTFAPIAGAKPYYRAKAVVQFKR
jgi:glycogen debranching enzyme